VRRATTLALAVVTLTSCNSWGYSQAPEPTPVPTKAQYKVYTADEVLWLREVMVTTDSLSGVPFKKELSCTSCRISLPLDAVDSVRIGRSNTTKTVVIAVTSAFVILLLAGFSSVSYD